MENGEWQRVNLSCPDHVHTVTYSTRPSRCHRLTLLVVGTPANLPMTTEDAFLGGRQRLHWSRVSNLDSVCRRVIRAVGVNRLRRVATDVRSDRPRSATDTRLTCGVQRHARCCSDTRAVDYFPRCRADGDDRKWLDDDVIMIKTIVVDRVRLLLVQLVVLLWETEAYNRSCNCNDHIVVATVMRSLKSIITTQTEHYSNDDCFNPTFNRTLHRLKCL